MDTRKTRLLARDGSPKIIWLQPRHSTGGSSVDAEDRRTVSCRLNLLLLLLLLFITTTTTNCSWVVTQSPKDQNSVCHYCQTLTNVYTDLISLQIISYMPILHPHLPSAVLKRSENRQFSWGSTQSVALLGVSTVLEGTQTTVYTSTRRKTKECFFLTSTTKPTIAHVDL
jgi:hypothetical protein